MEGRPSSSRPSLGFTQDQLLSRLAELDAGVRSKEVAARRQQGAASTFEKLQDHIFDALQWDTARAEEFARLKAEEEAMAPWTDWEAAELAPLAGDPYEGVRPDEHPGESMGDEQCDDDKVKYDEGEYDEGEYDVEGEHMLEEATTAANEGPSGQTARLNAKLLASLKDSLDRMDRSNTVWS